jgi:hypothetical protein
LTSTGAQWNGTESHSRFISRLDRGHQPTHGFEPPSRCAYIKGGEGGRGTNDEVHRDLISLPHHSLDRSLRRKAGNLHTALSPKPPPRNRRLTLDPDLLPLRRADLLPLHRQVPIRRLQRCRARRTSPLVRHTNPKTISTMFIRFRPTRTPP